MTQERALQAAMLASDVDGLDRLLHPELLAVGSDGQLVDKDLDLESHRSGVVEIAELVEEEARVKVVGDTALTFVVLALRATIDGADASGRYRYTRTWTRAGGACRSWGRTSVRHAEPHRGTAAGGALRDNRAAVRR